MPAVWPAGSWMVWLDGSAVQSELSPAQRRTSRHYRIGSARRSYDDPSFVHQVQAFDGNGLRPFSPVHLTQNGALGGEVLLSWVRRTRIEGDSWDLPEVPLGEETESYRVRILHGVTVLREIYASSPSWTYSVADQLADGVIADDQVEVAQISARYGAGLDGRMMLS